MDSLSSPAPHEAAYAQLYPEFDDSSDSSDNSSLSNSLSNSSNDESKNIKSTGARMPIRKIRPRRSARLGKTTRRYYNDSDTDDYYIPDDEDDEDDNTSRWERKRRTPDMKRDKRGTKRSHPYELQEKDRTSKRFQSNPSTLYDPKQKRKAQNRAAQRAFRARKEQLVHQLQTRIQELQTTSQQDEELMQENDRLREQLQALEEENALLRQARFTFDPGEDVPDAIVPSSSQLEYPLRNQSFLNTSYA
ncbi:hypothetical protein BCR43DRAFT_492024 [Syncephalastrum racemosum]|uniref:BZIP domain-containing protein n=1 Tax=Syncephalastrum racemosum TaxID=13706 RepID=A0A1X2HD03_SYNRA|nr:hypothetical protein BCR43DRAFT_492024 [Syncephalastrum racemosum]